MRLISHRGNLTNREFEENQPKYIERAIEAGYDCEIDIWLTGDKLYLGHDEPLYSISFEWLFKYKGPLLLHCKNPAILQWLHTYNCGFVEKWKPVMNFNYFWNDQDKYTLTSLGIPLCYPGTNPINDSILMKAEHFVFDPKNIYGICSDYIERFKC